MFVIKCDDNSVGDMYVEEVEAERLHAAEISSRPEGDVSGSAPALSQPVKDYKA